MDPATTASDGADAFLQLDRAAKQAGASIASALAGGQSEGRKLDDVLKTVGQRLAAMALRTTGGTLVGALSSTLGATLTGASGASAGGASLAAPPALAHLDQVSSAMPPAGIASVAPPPGQAARAASISVTIQTPDAESFRRSEAQVTAAIARAVQRGQRSL